MVVVTPSTVTAVFNAWIDADLAVNALTKMIGLHRDCITVLFTKASSGRASTGLAHPVALDLATAAARAFGPEYGLFYAEALLRGDVVVLVRVDGGDTADLASDALKRCGALDVDAR